MKKLILALAFPALLSLTAKAQDDSESRKPETGDVTTEIGLNIFSNQYHYYNGYYNGGYFGTYNNGLGYQLSLNSIKGRYFTSEDFAYRLSINPSFNKRRSDINKAFPTEISTLNFSISPGVEKHFKGTKKLSPYIGAEVAYTLHKVNATFVDPSTNTKVKIQNGSRQPGSGIIDHSYTTIGLNGIAGTDFYFAHKFYIGLELGYGVFYYKEKDIIETPENGTVTTTEGGDGIYLNPYINPALRLGFSF